MSIASCPRCGFWDGTELHNCVPQTMSAPSKISDEARDTFSGFIPAASGEYPTIAQNILAQCAAMRKSGAFIEGTSLCWSPEELELLAMFAIDAKNRIASCEQRVRELEAMPRYPIEDQIFDDDND